MGIEPLGTMEKISSLVEYRVWKPSPAASAEECDSVSDVLEAAVESATPRSVPR
jgi:hypothetical protein